MTSETISDRTATRSDVDAVKAGYQAVANRDLPGFAAGFHADATWNHRNPDRLGGIKDGVDAIIGFLAESMQLTAGTLQAVPELFMSDGAGHVAVLTRITATRPDGRTFDDQQILYFTVEDDLVRSVDQYIGDPPVVTDFWA